MSSYRITVAVWEDYQGGFTAAALDGNWLVATDTTSSSAVKQLRDVLEWRYRNGDEMDSSIQLEDPRLAYYRVPVRSEFFTERGVFATENFVRVRTVCVHGRTADRSIACFLPMLELHFNCYSEEAVKELAVDYARRQMGSFAPLELARVLLPRNVQLDAIRVRHRPTGLALGQETFPALESVAEPLAARARRKRFGHAWGRDSLTRQLAERLARDKSNLLLVGPPSVGKTTLLADAIREIARIETTDDDSDGESPSASRFWLTSAAQLIAGMQYLGQWEERCEEVIDELAQSDGVLCIENLRDLCSLGGAEPSSSLAAFFLPYLEHRELRMVIEATWDELDACRQALPGFENLFQVVAVDPFDRANSIGMLQHLLSMRARAMRIEVDAGLAEQIYRLFRRFLPYQALPGPAAEFARNLFDGMESGSSGTIDSQACVRQFVRLTGIPERMVRDDVPLSYEAILAEFEARIFGQDEACRAAARLVSTFKAGLNDPGRPLGVFVFCGPTGVGKTELAKVIAEVMFGGKDAASRLVRLDMSEYAGYGAGERLIMQPDGKASELLQKVRTQPFVLLLLDEIEKASPEVFDVLLSVLDEGRLTDRYGRTTTFRSAVIVMTSNLGAESVKAMGFSDTPARSYESELLAFFRPEFFNRLDGAVTFGPLPDDAILAIVRKQLRQVAGREGLDKAELKIAWTEELERQLAREGVDQRYGARPLQRTIEQRVTTPLAHWIVNHPDVTRRTLHLDFDEQNELHIESRLE